MTDPQAHDILITEVGALARITHDPLFARLARQLAYDFSFDESEARCLKYPVCRTSSRLPAISLRSRRPTQYQLLPFGVLWPCVTALGQLRLGGPGCSSLHRRPRPGGRARSATALAVPRSGLDLRDVRSAFAQAPRALLLTAALLGWSVVRLMLGVSDLASQPLVALRDFAPYGYAVVALLSFVLVSAGLDRANGSGYTGHLLHLVWVSGAPHLQAALWSGLMLGGAPIFTLRPDFDSAILGLAVGLALHDLLESVAARRDAGEIAALVLFGFANGYQLLALDTRRPWRGSSPSGRSCSAGSCAVARATCGGGVVSPRRRRDGVAHHDPRQPPGAADPAGRAGGAGQRPRHPPGAGGCMVRRERLRDVRRHPNGGGRRLRRRFPHRQRSDVSARGRQLQGRAVAAQLPDRRTCPAGSGRHCWPP